MFGLFFVLGSIVIYIRDIDWNYRDYPFPIHLLQLQSTLFSDIVGFPPQEHLDI